LRRRARLGAFVGTLTAALLAPLLVWGCGSGGATAPVRPADLNNTYLSPALSQWLIGAISRLATPEEVQAYLALRDDAAANAFIEQFWARRDPYPQRGGNPVRDIFDERAHDADRRFSEAGYLGRRTDRGRTYVLYGEPKTIDFEINPRQGEPPVERWSYAADTPTGLDGRHPALVYRFVKKGDLTVLYTVPVSQRGTLLEPPG
jgi:GWxTD domain-containing protein